MINSIIMINQNITKSICNSIDHSEKNQITFWDLIRNPSHLLEDGFSSAHIIRDIESNDRILLLFGYCLKRGFESALSLESHGNVQETSAKVDADYILKYSRQIEYHSTHGTSQMSRYSSFNFQIVDDFEGFTQKWLIPQ